MLFSRLLTLGLATLGAGAGGCVADLVPLSTGTPNATDTSDLATGSSDMATSPTTPPSPSDAGGPAFNPTIWSSVQSLGCAGCHSGGPPLKLVAAPTSASDWSSNYREFSSRAKNGDKSLVLTKNVAGSGVSHAGGSAFSSTSDPTYVQWLAWINAGAPQ
jgi:hypothetical protein